jgi:phosphonate transport system substrate-binding protein
MNNSVMARDDVPQVLSERVLDLLLALDQTAAGQEILEGMSTARFHAAKNSSYNKVRDYVAVFEQEVRPVERK